METNKADTKQNAVKVVTPTELTTIKIKLTSMRINAKLSRRKLAEISGFNEHTIKAYEITQTPPSRDYVEFCSLYFGYTLESIIDSTKKQLEKMDNYELQSQRYKIYKKANKDEFFANAIPNIITDDDIADCYKSANTLKENKLKSVLDLQILELLKNASDSKKKAIIELLKGGG